MKILQTAFVLAMAMTLSLTSCKPKDADVKAKVETKLRTNPDASNVMVTVNDGVATLSGEVKDEATKAAVEAAAKDAGAKSVVNSTTVFVEQMPVMADDTTLTSSVKDATKDYPTVKAAVNAGVITLTGSIQRAALPNLMMALNGLNPKSINNQLTIK
jgi:osmotically-inducible protein OsmY